MAFFGKLLAFFRSTLLALVLLIAILVSCIVGAAALPVPVGRVVVFSSLWFNGLLILLVLNAAFCFFRAARFRNLNPVSGGIIVFHLSFILLFAGIVYNSLFYYKGALRLTEGESMALGDPNVYDEEYWGPFFNHQWMRGTVTLHKLYTQYKEGNLNKGVANELSIVDGNRHAKGIIYPTRHLAFNGFKFFKNKDGFAPLLVLYDRHGKEIYGAYTSLQSFKQKDKSLLYVTGTKQDGPGSIDFPQIQNMPPLFKIQFTYHLPKLKNGIAKASFKIWEYSKDKKNGQGRLVYEGTAAMGQNVVFSDHALSMQEVRYWASMDVRYNPGLPLILTSLWIGLGGIILTTVARLINNKRG